MKIIGPASAARPVVLANLTASSLFVDEMFPALWDVALDYDIDPVGMVAQSLQETGGEFTGDVKPEQHNPAGIKWHDAMQALLAAQGVKADQNPRHPLAFALYFTAENWRVGARVHAEHLKYGWCGAPVPAGYAMLDPRYKAARSSAAAKGDAVTWADLGTRWAPSPDYGQRIEAIMQRLSGVT